MVALAAADVLDELLVLLELPQPATASATPTRARIDVLGTGVSPVVRGIGRDGFSDSQPRPDRNLAIPSSALRQRSTHGPPFARFLYDSAVRDYFPQDFGAAGQLERRDRVLGAFDAPNDCGVQLSAP